MCHLLGILLNGLRCDILLNWWRLNGFETCSQAFTTKILICLTSPQSHRIDWIVEWVTTNEQKKRGKKKTMKVISFGFYQASSFANCLWFHIQFCRRLFFLSFTNSTFIGDIQLFASFALKSMSSCRKKTSICIYCRYNHSHIEFHFNRSGYELHSLASLHIVNWPIFLLYARSVLTDAVRQCLIIKIQNHSPTTHRISLGIMSTVVQLLVFCSWNLFGYSLWMSKHIESIVFVFFHFHCAVLPWPDLSISSILSIVCPNTTNELKTNRHFGERVKKPTSLQAYDCFCFRLMTKKKVPFCDGQGE